MANIAALVSGFGWHVQDLKRAADGLGVGFQALPFPNISAGLGVGNAQIQAEGVDLTQLDGVLVRMMPPGSLEQVVFRMDALHALEARGIPILNPPRAIEAAVDKYLTLERVAARGLAIPRTWVGEHASDALDAFELLGRDVVVKPLFGSEGRGLVRVSDYELARRTFRTLEQLGAVLYVQEFVPHPGFDLRAFVIAGKVIGAIRRQAQGDWRTNVAVGATASAITLDAETERMAVNAACAVGARAAGVDLLPDPRTDRLLVVEVNAVPGWKSLSSATGIDVATLLVRELLDGQA